MNAVVLIPAFCPEEAVTEIAEQLLSLDFQVVIVDDGSGESYQAIFRELEKDCVVLHHEVNRGKGQAIKTGLRYIQQEMPDCSVIGIMDADGQHTAEDMSRVLIFANLNPQVFVTGCRDVDRMPRRSQIGNRLTRTIFYHLFHLRISDTQTGMRAFSREMIPDLLEVEGSRYEYEMNVLVMLAKRKIPVKEIPIRTIYRDEANSTSHFHVVRDSFLIYRKLLMFALSSLSGFLIDYGLFTLFTLLLPKKARFLVLSNIIARVISGYCNYSINCSLVFQRKKSRSTAVQYILLAAGILFLNNVILMAYTQAFRIQVYAAKLLTEITLFIFSWLVQSMLIFRRTQKKELNGNEG